MQISVPCRGRTCPKQKLPQSRYSLFYLQLCLGACLLTSGAFCLQLEHLFAYNGKVRLRSTSMDYKQKTPIVNKQASPQNLKQPGPKKHDSQTRDRIQRFLLVPEKGNFLHVWGDFLTTYAENVEKHKKNPLENFNQKIPWTNFPEIADFCPLSW